MIFLLDTSALSDLVREHPAALARLQRVPATDRVVTCAVVRGEILQGLRKLSEGKRRRVLEEKALQVLAGFPCESISAPVADVYADLKVSQERKGFRLDENDLWIAATARFLGAALVTRDCDFNRVEELRVEDWSK